MPLNYVTLTGTLPGAAGAVATFTASNWLTDSTDQLLIPPAPVRAGLSATTVNGVAAGTFSISLLATDNGAPLPSGWFWTVTFTGLPPGTAAQSFSFFLAHTPTAQDISTLAPVSPVTPQAAPAVPGVYLIPSGDITGVTDQAAVAAAETLGKTVYFGPGTFWGNFTKQSNTIWQCAGRYLTTFKAPAGSNKDVIQGANFSTLTLSGSLAGIGGWGIRDCTIDGNKAAQSGTSYGLRVYGYNFDLTNVSIGNCLTDALYTEWGGAGNPGPDASMEARYYGLKLHDCNGNGWVNRGPHDSRGYDITIFHNGAAGYGYWGQASSNAPGTVAAASNGADLSTFTSGSPGTLNVSTTLGYPAASINAAQGSIVVATAKGNVTLTYTGLTATAFTGCVAQGSPASGSTVSTGGSVAPIGGGYTAAGQLLYGVHVYGAPLWDYVLDTQTHLTDCIGEVAAAGGGCILARGNLDTTITGGIYVTYPGAAQNGCGLQIGDAANFCFGLRMDSYLFGFSGADAAHAAINIVNDGGGNSIDAMIYQTTANPVWSGGSPGFGGISSSSRYRLYGMGNAFTSNVAASLDQTFGTVRRWVPGAAAKAWTLTPAGGADAMNLAASVNRLDHNNGLLDRWWATSYANPTVEISGANATIALGPTAGSGVDTTVSRLVQGVLQVNGVTLENGLASGSGGFSRMGAVVGWTMPPIYAQASTILPSAGVLFMWLCEIPAAATTSNFNMFVTVAGNTLANVYAALVNASGTIVAQTANRAADSQLTTGGSLWSPPWQSAFAAPAGEYYACLLIGSATTMPTFVSGSSRLQALTNIGCTAAAGNLRAATTGSGLTSLPASPITMSGITSNQNPMWAALT